MDIQTLIDSYVQWLRSEITFEKIGEYYEITTPFLDDINDYIQIYVRMDDDKIYITDDGATLKNLKMSGFHMDCEKRSTLNSVLAPYGVTLCGNELTSVANINTFPQKKHLFFQAILKVHWLKQQIGI